MNLLWWHWIAFGLVLAAAELASAGGFYIVFFGVGAIVVGVLAKFGLAGPEWVQLVLFAFISTASLLLFRGRLLKTMQRSPQAPAVDALIGEVGVATEELVPGKTGRVELRGTPWTARNHSHHVVHTGARVRVVSVDGLTVDVEPEGARS